MDIQKEKQFGIYSVAETELKGEVAIWVNYEPDYTVQWLPDEAIEFAAYIIGVATAIKEENND